MWRLPRAAASWHLLWNVEADRSVQRCPNGAGAFTTTASSTKGTANDCGSGPASSPMKINEIESNGGTPDDWRSTDSFVGFSGEVTFLQVG